MSIATTNWKEAIVEFYFHGSNKVKLICNMRRNPLEENHISVCGYLSQVEINNLGFTDFSPHSLWVDFYNHNDNFLMLEANSEDGIQNYSMTVWYR